MLESSPAWSPRGERIPTAVIHCESGASETKTLLSRRIYTPRSQRRARSHFAPISRRARPADSHARRVCLAGVAFTYTRAVCTHGRDDFRGSVFGLFAHRTSAPTAILITAAVFLRLRTPIDSDANVNVKKKNPRGDSNRIILQKSFKINI